MNKYYLVTIRKHRVNEYVNRLELLEVVNYLKTKNVIHIYGRAERHGRYKQLHYHFISRMRYYDITKYKGFFIHYKRILKRDVNYVKGYIDKHYHPLLHTDLDTDLGNYYNYHYALDEDPL